MPSSLDIAADKLARMVALSPTFQGQGDYATAIRRVHRKNALGTEPRPFACVSQGESHRLELVAGGAQNYFRPAGSLFLYMTRDTDPEFFEDSIQAERKAADYFGSIVEDVAALAAADDPTSSDGTSHLAIVRIERGAFDETDEQHWNSLGRFYFAAYMIEWGDGG